MSPSFITNNMSVVSNGGLWFSGTYIPFTCDISGITNGQTTVVTTSVDHGFVVGNSVQFVIPLQWGIRQLSGKTGYVLSTTSDTVTVNIDSSQFDSFSTPIVTLPTVIDQPQILPVGDGNTGYLTPNVSDPALQIPGTFRNTYP